VKGEIMPDAPKTEKWTARENHHGKVGVFLHVHGLVQVANTNQQPRLTPSATPGGPPKTLVLDLTIDTSGQGNTVICWKAAHYDRTAKVNEYETVDIRWQGKSIATCKVLDDKEHGAHLAALTAAANATAKPPAGKKPAPKPPAKKPPAKEAPAKEAPAKEAPAKSAPAKGAPAKGAPAKSAPAKKAPPKKAARKGPTKKAAKKKAPAKKKAAKKRSGAKKGGSATGRVYKLVRRLLGGGKKKKKR
jgi:hypothetical protein